MTNEEARKILLAKIDCEERQMCGVCSPSYSNCDNCKLQYEQGTCGEFVKALRMAYRALKDRK